MSLSAKYGLCSTLSVLIKKCYYEEYRYPFSRNTVDSTRLALVILTKCIYGAEIIVMNTGFITAESPPYEYVNFSTPRGIANNLF